MKRLVGGTHAYSRPLVCAYATKSRIVRRRVLALAQKREGGQFLSQTMREIMARYHGVSIGLYSHGACFTPGAMDRGTTVGRYSSIAAGVRAMNRNHPLEFASTHAYFFNPVLGVVEHDSLPYEPLEIGSDVWTGHNAIIMPSVKSIGHGAVVAAGAVVNKDVPPYAVVVGNPARVVRYRFDEDTIHTLLESRWWERPIDELKDHLCFIQNPKDWARIANSNPATNTTQSWD